jgi:hypothetical protein
MSHKRSEFEQQMSELESELKRLEAEYNMFFAGRLPRLPWETRSRVDALVKRYDRLHIRNTAERFRFGTLQARYVKFCELWERTLRAREEERPQRGRRRGAHIEPAAPPGPPPEPRSASGAPRAPRAHGGAAPARVVGVTAIRDPAADGERLTELYERLSAARQAAGEKPVPFDAFKQVVRAQVSKHGGGQRDVAFRIAVEGGKVTLTAAALKGE